MTWSELKTPEERIDAAIAHFSNRIDQLRGNLHGVQATSEMEFAKRVLEQVKMGAQPNTGWNG